jgi:hypothetical protein
VADFQLGNKSAAEEEILAAFNRSKRCAVMKSPFQVQAKKNLAAIQTQYKIKERPFRKSPYQYEYPCP